MKRHRAGWVLVLAFLLACEDEGCDTTTSVVIEECARLSSEPTWNIRPGGSAELGAPLFGEINLTVGQSRRATLWPLVASECEGDRTVEWHVADGQVASLLVDGARSGSVWLTGLSPGTTELTARLRFIDGVEREAQPASVQVTQPEGPPPGSVAVVEGETDLEPSPGDGVTPADFRRFIPFTTSVAGRIHISVDWSSPLNRIAYVLTEGHCESPGGCGTLVLSSSESSVKPVEKSTDQPAGRYTLRIDNLGPGRETVRYQVRIVPR